MSDEEARALVAQRFDVPRETMERLDRFVALLRDEGQRQNLIATSTYEHVWSRHILDSAQLLGHVPASLGEWIDLGSGPGFPGLIIAAISDWHVTLVESRRMRVAFLEQAAKLLGLGERITILGISVEKVPRHRYDVISARAFAPLPRLLDLAARFAAPETVWVLPKGRNAVSELEAIRGSWQGMFRIAASLTDPDSAIIVADHVERRRAG